jgi:predicted regulator of Ras-like GTPase activity (Roadblock/LC7/MglB family)
MHALSGLRDVAGVHGSFLLSEAGALLNKDLPAVFHDDLLAETGPRIARLCEALEHGGAALDNLSLRFADHKLHICRSSGAFLCVIADAQVNVPALRMALALVVRRLANAEIEPRRSEPPSLRTPPSRASERPLPNPAPSPSLKDLGRSLFRGGRSVDD